MSELRDLKCPNCGAPLPGEDCYCIYCGSKLVREKTEENPKHRFSGNFSTPKGNYGYDFSYGGARRANEQSAAATAPPQPQRAEASQRKIIAAVLAILFGVFGIQFFYLGKIGSGLCSVLFCWTGIPAIIGFFQGIVWLCNTDEEWEKKYGKR